MKIQRCKTLKEKKEIEQKKSIEEIVEDDYENLMINKAVEIIER